MGIKEREIGDWICAHPETLWNGLEIIGREVSLNHGRLDLLGWDGSGTQVIELKARPLKEKDVGQVLRYRHDVRLQLRTIGHQQHPVHWPKERYAEASNEQAFHNEWNWYHSLSAEAEAAPSVQPVLIGRSIDDTVLAAAFGANITVMLWKYNERFKFTHAILADSFIVPREPIAQWARAVSNRAFQECVKAASIATG